MAKLTLSAFSDEYSESIVEQCKMLQAQGIAYMELRGVNGKNVADLTKQEKNQLKKILEDYDIQVSAIGSPIGKIRLDGDIPTHLEKAKGIFETANGLGVKNIRAFSFYLPEGKTREECKGQVFDEMEKLVKLSEESGVTLCHENEALIYGESPDCCLELLQHFGGKLRCVLDMGNFVLDGYDPVYAYRLLENYIEYFHIKDALSAGAIVPAGKGEAHIQDILDDYRAYGKKDTFITLEPHLQTFSGLNALVGKSFENPYKYETPQAAFLDGLNKLRGVL